MDPNYYAFATPLLLGLTTLMCVVVWWYQRSYRYLLWLAASQACLGLGLAIQMLLNTEMRLLYAPLTTLVYAAGISALGQAVLQRLGARMHWGWMTTANILVMAAMWQAALHPQHSSARLTVMSLYVALVHTVVLLHAPQWRSLSRLDRVTLALYALFAASMLGRLMLLPVEIPALDASWISRHLAWWFTTASVMVLCAGMTASLTASALADSTAHLRHERNHDSLTGVLTRRAFEERCGAQPYAQGLRALVYADIDHFKNINDQYGHAMGDAVLAGIGHTLQHSVRPVDLVGRLGGEEFALALHGVDAAQAQQLVARVAERLRSHASPSRPAVTASLGWVMLAPNETLDSAMQRADRLLYQAKAAGRDCVYSDTRVANNRASSSAGVA
jgi:diguanylate cyclase